MTAIGMFSITSFHLAQKWKLDKLSAPISQTKCTCGCRFFNARTMSIVRHEPSRLSRSVTTMPGAFAWRSTAVNLRARGSDAWFLRGFCGETSHQMRSSPRRFMAVLAKWEWPECGGSKLPPNRPIFIPGSSNSLDRASKVLPRRARAENRTGLDRRPLTGSNYQRRARWPPCGLPAPSTRHCHIKA